MSKPKILELEEKSKKGYIVAWRSSEQVISNGNDYNFNINEEESAGDFFELTDKGEIKILKDCMAYLSSKIFIDKSAGQNYVMTKININNKSVSNSLKRINSQDYTQVIDSGICYNLKENDLVSIKIDYTSDSGNPEIRQGRQYSSISIFTI